MSKKILKGTVFVDGLRNTLELEECRKSPPFVRTVTPMFSLLRTNPDITLTDVHVLFAVMENMDKYNICPLFSKDLAKLLGISDQHLSLCIKRLVSHGYVCRTGFVGRAFRLMLNPELAVCCDGGMVDTVKALWTEAIDKQVESAAAEPLHNALQSIRIATATAARSRSKARKGALLGNDTSKGKKGPARGPMPMATNPASP